MGPDWRPPRLEGVRPRGQSRGPRPGVRQGSGRDRRGELRRRRRDGNPRHGVAGSLDGPLRGMLRISPYWPHRRARGFGRVNYRPHADGRVGEGVRHRPAQVLASSILHLGDRRPRICHGCTDVKPGILAELGDGGLGRRHVRQDVRQDGRRELLDGLGGGAQVLDHRVFEVPGLPSRVAPRDAPDRVHPGRSLSSISAPRLLSVITRRRVGACSSHAQSSARIRPSRSAWPNA